MAAILKILPSWIQPFWTKKTSLIHSDWTLWWQPSWILPSWIQQFCTKLCLKLIHSHSTWWWQQPSWNLIIASGHAGFSHCHLGFRHLVILSQIHSKNSHATHLTQTNSIWLKLMMAAHLEFCHVGFSHLEFGNLGFRPLVISLSDNHSHLPLGFHHLHIKNFNYSFWLNLMMAAILKSAILDSDTLLSSLRFTQKYSSCHSDSDSN